MLLVGVTGKGILEIGITEPIKSYYNAPYAIT